MMKNWMIHQTTYMQVNVGMRQDQAAKMKTGDRSQLQAIIFKCHPVVVCESLSVCVALIFPTQTFLYLA